MYDLCFLMQLPVLKWSWTDKGNEKDKIKLTNLLLLYLWIVLASVGLVLSCCLLFHLVGIKEVKIDVTGNRKRQTSIRIWR